MSASVGNTFGVGSDREALMGGGGGARDAFAMLVDDQGAFQCGWQVIGHHEEDLYDAAWDSEGGLWLVGGATGRYRFLDGEGSFLAGNSDGESWDGFVIRLRPPDP